MGEEVQSVIYAAPTDDGWQVIIDGTQTVFRTYVEAANYIDFVREQEAKHGNSENGC